MKYFYVAALSFLISNGAFAANYSCFSDVSSEEASLSIFDQAGQLSLQWDGPRDASSEGILIGVEDAPYSPTKGYLIFSLSDFYKTEDSGFRLAISPRHTTHELTAFLYFDNDGHAEEETKYTCLLVENP